MKKKPIVKCYESPAWLRKGLTKKELKECVVKIKFTGREKVVRFDGKVI